MSSTNRGKGRRAELDTYETPGWVVDRLIERVPLPPGRWLEPCGATGQIIRAVQNRRPDVTWDAIEIRPECRDPLVRLVGPDHVQIGDFLDPTVSSGRWDCVLTNPPFSAASQFLQRGLEVAPVCCLLLRINFLESVERHRHFRTAMPAVYVVPNRPSFVAGTTDSCGYAWFCWTREPRRTGPIEVLDLTPLEERKAARLPFDSPTR